MSVHIFLESLKIRKKESILLIIQCIIVFCLVIAAGCLMETNKTQITKLKKTASKIYKLTDNYIGQDEKMFFSQSDNVLLLKKFYEWEKNNSLWKYIIVNRQYVSTVNTELNPIFEVGYESGQRTEGTYKSIQVNDNFLQHYSVKISEGRSFITEDYNYDGGSLPVLLGNEYKNTFELHDKINLMYLGKRFNCEIVGFLDQNSYFNNGYDLELLDYYIILPSIENFIPSNIPDKEIKNFELKLYLDKCGGYAVSDLNTQLLQKQVSKKCYEIDVIPYSIEGRNNYHPIMWGLEGEQLGKIFYGFAVLIIISSICCISLNMSVKISAMESIYAVYIMNGIQRRQVMLSIWQEIILIVFTAGILADIISWIYWGEFSIMSFGICFPVIIILSGIYPCIMIQKLKLSMSMNEQR